jgi:hypothetical protein
MAEKKRNGFTLQVPLDASRIEGFKPEQKVKVLVVQQDGSVHSATAKLDAKGYGAAGFEFKENPGALRVLVGPETASDEELQGLQTIRLSVSARRWKDVRELKLPAIQISPFYWWWWLRWCREFTIRGRVLCPDGSPVPGAQVCAYDVDAWWWWSSKQVVGCSTTDATGSFEITFRWCCGWWPWWWWRNRVWHLEPYLIDRILPELQRDPILKRIPLPDPVPDFRIFEKILGEDELAVLNVSPPVAQLSREEAAIKPGEPVTAGLPAQDERAAAQPRFSINPEILPVLRDKLLEKLPMVADLERLRIWPWWPWQPWWDCTPDIIFRATQDCQEPGMVIVDEGYGDARWNIPTDLDVTLVANDQACCLGDGDDDPEGACALITDICRNPINLIGGNPGALGTPAGYLSPQAVSTYGDRPYGGRVLIEGQVGNDVDYYEFEWSGDGGASWHDMPVASVGDVAREYWIPATNTFTWVSFLHTIDSRLVFESRQHYESTHDPGTWGATRFWMAHNYFGLMNWRTNSPFINGEYRLRIKGWQLVGGHLANPQILPVCSIQTPAELVLRIDNRLVGAASGHPPSTPDHPCGSGTVHTCTLEPDTDFLAVRIVHADPSQEPTPVGACGEAPLTSGDVLQVDFFAHDPEGHLAKYTLQATYGENLVVNLLGLPGVTLTPLGGAPVPPAAQVGPTYFAARDHQGALPPVWHGGAIRLEVSAHLAFPETCCYQLELRAHKRTIVGCDHSLWNHTNYSEFSFMVAV